MVLFLDQKKVIRNNIKRALPEIDENNLKNIENSMWNNYGRIFAEYIFLKDFRYGKLASQVLEMVEEYVKPGVSTLKLDQICHDYIVKRQDAIPAPLNYKGFPK